jgi:WD40 repeat protein
VQACPLVEVQTTDHCTACAFLRDGNAIIAGCQDGSIRSFNLDSITMEWESTCHKAVVVGVAVEPNKNAVLSAARDGTVIVHACSNGDMTLHINELRNELKGNALHSIALSPLDAAQMAAAWAGGILVLAAPWRSSHPWVIARYNIPHTQVQVFEVRM